MGLRFEGAGRFGARWWRVLGFMSAWVLCTLALALCVLPSWVARHFGEVGFDQVVFQFAAGPDSLFSADAHLIRQFVRTCLLAPVLCALVLVATFKRWLADRLLVCLALIWLAAFGLVARGFDIPGYLVAQWGGDQFAAAYLDPEQVPVVAPVRPKNLLLIYVESFESSYADPAVSGRDLLQPLHRFEQLGRRFAHVRQTPGTGWTTAGVVASQCGVPLKVFGIWNKNRQGEMLPSFLPNATCLGDVLARHGYTNVFMNGPDLRFSGLGKFLRAHGYHELVGKQEWLQRGYEESGLRFWGLPDDQLLLQARHRLDELMQQGKPFNLTLLTVDTHGPKGHLSAACAQRGFVGFPGVVGCTATLLAELLDHIQQQGWQDRIQVMLVGDHLAMKNPLSARLQKASHRSPYNLFLSSDKPVLTKGDVSYFDLFPTLLTFLGFQVPGGHLALGWDAWRDDLPRDTPERWKNLDRMLQNSTRYAKLWGFE